MIELMGKASSVQFESGELKLFWDDNSYNKEVKATYSKKGKEFQLVKFEFNQFGKNLRLRTTLQMDSKLEIVRPVLEGPLTKSF